MAFWRRAARERSTIPPDPYGVARAWWQTLKPLGPFRQQVIACLRADTIAGENRFSARAGETLFDAFRRLILSKEASASPDPIGQSILAAGRLLIGDLSGADRIIDLLPATPHVTDHGNGKCLLMPARVLSKVLPLPESAGKPDRWTAHSPEQAALRGWLGQNRGRLVWVEAKGEYQFGR